MLKMSFEELDWLCERIPDAPRSRFGGRPPADKRKVVAGIFWILDNGAKWKDLPRRFASKSTVHRWFQKWVADGLFEEILRAAGSLVEERDGYRLYECFIDLWSQAIVRSTVHRLLYRRSGIGLTRVGKGVNLESARR